VSSGTLNLAQPTAIIVTFSKYCNADNDKHMHKTVPKLIQIAITYTNRTLRLSLQHNK